MKSNDKERGIYDKYTVIRNDGSSAPGEKHEKCKFFVLDLTHDPFALPAILAYANACARQYPQLAADLKTAYARSEPRAEPSPIESAWLWFDDNNGFPVDVQDVFEKADADTWHEGELAEFEAEEKPFVWLGGEEEGTLFGCLTTSGEERVRFLYSALSRFNDAITWNDKIRIGRVSALAQPPKEGE